MSSNTNAPAIQSRADTFGGKPVMRDTRLKVETVLLHLAASLSVEQTPDEYPLLTAADIRACLSYAAAKLDIAPAQTI